MGLAVVSLLLRAAPPGAKTVSETHFTPEEVAFFEKDVQPILQANCIKCHGGAKVRGSLRLSTRDGVLKGGENGPAAVPGKPADSLLIAAVKQDASRLPAGVEGMPVKGKLAGKDIETLAKWIQMGLPWTPGKSEIVPEEPKGIVINDAARNYWCYKPVKRPEVPAVKNRAWVRNPIDAFLLARLEAKGLKPAAPADRVALIRRVYYDLTGLPPTPEEVDAFVTDRAPDAYEKLVDRLLDSPHYGEKWGRHWLDLVRYAETNGYERDWPSRSPGGIRDYVIRASTTTSRTTSSSASSSPATRSPGYNPDAVIATGYYRLGIWDDEPADPLLARYDGLDGIISDDRPGLSRHVDQLRPLPRPQGDPIPQADYYRLLAFFRT